MLSGEDRKCDAFADDARRFVALEAAGQHTDADTIAVRPLLDQPNVTLLVNAEVGSASKRTRQAGRSLAYTLNREGSQEFYEASSVGAAGGPAPPGNHCSGQLRRSDLREQLPGDHSHEHAAQSGPALRRPAGSCRSRECC